MVSIDKDHIAFSLRNGLYMPFLYKGRQVVVHNSSVSFREKIWVDDDLVVSRLGFSMVSTNEVQVENDTLVITFGYRDGFAEIFMVVTVDGEVVHEVSERLREKTPTKKLFLGIAAAGVIGAVLGYGTGYLAKILFGGA